MQLVCVWDLDHTLGVFDSVSFCVRPHVDFLFNFLKVAQFDIILWSLGTDEYVESIVNGFFSNNLCKIAFKIFGRTVCNKSMREHGISKHSSLIRGLYKRDILLFGFDDRINELMDERYDFRISIEPYNTKNANDTELIKVIEKIVNILASLN